MVPELALTASRQGGVFTRAQASAAGYGGPAIRQLTAPGNAWVVVRRGCYLAREVWERLDPHHGKPLAKDWAAHLSMRVQHVMSHDSAARAWSLPLLRSDLSMAHATRPSVTGCRKEHGVVHHCARPGLEAVFDLNGLPVTSLERTALDVARQHGWRHGLVALDGALQKGADLKAAERICASMKYWPGVTQVRRAIDLAMPGAETPLETLGRLNVSELGLGRPITQFPVRVGRGTAWCDLLVGRHVFEFDGRIKYRSTERGGYADRPAEEILWDEKVRERDIASQGLGLSRAFWEDCLGNGREAGMRRMAADFAATCQRFGTRLPDDVIAYAEKMWPARERRLRRQHVVLPPQLELPWATRPSDAA